MCTVTVLRAPGNGSHAPHVRLICNRDEQRSRPVARELVQRRLGARDAIMPIDPRSDGTWLGANDCGLVACLLNATPHPEATSENPSHGVHTSRGAIVPATLYACSIEEALILVRGLIPGQFPPFRLLVLTSDLFFIASSDIASITITDPQPLLAPLLLTSSGLGDHLVESPRRSLFNDLLIAAPDALAVQAEFHEHRWPDRSHLSVLMSRPDARTISRSTLDLFPDAVRLTHTPLNDLLDPERASLHAELSLLRTEIAA